MKTATAHPNGGARDIKPVSEAMREREAFKYDFIYYDHFKTNNSGRLLPASEIFSSSDSVLTGLAQLGAYQTNTERSFISLFNVSHEFIIAETVPLMRLTPNLPSHECPMSLSLCGTAIPREHGTCEHVLYIASGTESERGQLPISIVPNLATDDRFMRKPYCQFGEAGQFYAAVPIRTRNGINIGSYSVYNTKQPSSWDERSAQSMRDISHAIMDHLEVKRSKNAHRRSERMNRGLGSFIEGKSTLSGWQFGPNVAAFADDHNKEGALDATQQHLEHRHHKKKDDEPEISDTTMEAQDSAPVGPWPSTPIQTSSSAHEAVSPHASPQDSQEPGRPKAPYELAKLRGLSYSAAGTHGVFSKASNIVREAFEVAGCIFFDVTLGSYRSPKVQLSSDENDSDLSTSHQSSTSSGDEQSRALQTETPEAQCHLLGFSTAGASSINHTKLNHNHPRMAKRLLAKLLRRYPNGKIFNYDAVGELQSSDLSEDDDTKHSTTEAVPDYDSKSAEGGVPTGANQKEEARHSSRMEEGALIRSAFPGARSVVFFPVWDSRRERWFAGGFVYTLDPCRVFTSLGDLSFLTAFAKLTAAEIHNIETAQADKAKSDALGALSHELRSPLHGVILSAELLNDTDLTVFQGNATHTIETCCRTLLDTIDHLLDYSKVNSFVTIQKREARGTSSNLRKRRNQSKGIRNKKLHTNIGLDGIVEEVVESVFAGFNFQHMSVRQLSKQGRSAYTDIAALSRQDSAHAMEQLGPTLNDKEQLSLHFGDVLVYVSIDSSCDWKFYLQAGAIRRLVMNLVGNSLKYTEAGAIRVSLSQEPLSSNAPRSERTIKLVVEDTGKGISEDYLQHKLYKPFAQEDELAPGTGLGLSLVKKIVTQLGGRINVKSRVGVGSTFTVTFPLDQSPRAVELSEDDRAFENHIRELAGLRVRLAGFESQGVGGDSGDDSSVINGRTIVESICRETLHLELVDEQTEDIIPDLVIWSDNALPTNNPKDSQLFRVPNIIICQNALVAYQRNNLCNYIRHGGVFEFVSQPIAPRKLALTIQLAYQRWVNLSSLPSPPLLGTSRVSSPSPYDSRATMGAGEQEGTSVSSIDHTMTATSSLSEAGMRATLPNSPPGVSGLVDDSLQSGFGQKGLPGKLLLVDDNHINLKILSAYVRKLGREYETATNGKDAVEAYTRSPSLFAGVVMDISMPIMDGLEATRQIRAYEQRNQVASPVPILALTGMASDAVYRDALESGVHVFLTKPVRLGKLSEVLGGMDILTPPQEVDEGERRAKRQLQYT